MFFLPFFLSILYNFIYYISGFYTFAKPDIKIPLKVAPKVLKVRTNFRRGPLSCLFSAHQRQKVLPTSALR